jgi:hypothetical protein
MRKVVGRVTTGVLRASGKPGATGLDPAAKRGEEAA